MSAPHYTTHNSARECARRWFNLGDADHNMWALFALDGTIEDVPRMRDALRDGAVPNEMDAGQLLRYVEQHGERDPFPQWNLNAPGWKAVSS
jgi:hypothetical protein